MSWPSDDNRLYYAEWNLHKMGLESRVADPQAYLERVCSARFFLDRWAKVAKKKIEVRPRNVDQTYALSYYHENLIYLPPWARTDLVIIHELSHFCEPSKEILTRGRDKTNHGPHFIGAELALVKRFMGARPYNCLKHSLLAMEVEWIQPE